MAMSVQKDRLFRRPDVEACSPFLPPPKVYGGIELVKVDLPDEERDIALEKLNRLLNKYSVEKDIAQKLKKRMEKRFGGCWSCIVGSSFGCFLSHIEHAYLQARAERKEVILFRAA
ncbi:hypothetical protein SprV_0200590400 [Sparganum proliferum]